MPDDITADLAAIGAALDAGPTPGPWFVQYGDDWCHMCCTAVAAANTRARNDGQWSAADCDSLVALTFHQCYPFVQADCERDEANSAYIAACHPARMARILADHDRLTAALAAAESRASVALEIGAQYGADRDRLAAEVEALRAERDEWAAKWHAMRRQYADLRWPGMTNEVHAADAARTAKEAPHG